MFLVRLVEKIQKIAKSGQNVEGPTQRSSDPRSGEVPRRDEGFLHRSMAERGKLAILRFAAVKLLFITQKILCLSVLLFHPFEDLSIG